MFHHHNQLSFHQYHSQHLAGIKDRSSNRPSPLSKVSLITLNLIILNPRYTSNNTTREHHLNSQLNNPRYLPQDSLLFPHNLSQQT